MTQPLNDSASTLHPAQAADDSQNFLVDLGGVLSILSDSIYTAGPEVFIRELMQNGHDAITARRMLGPSFVGMLSIEVATAKDGLVTVIVKDNGIGLSSEESRQALSTIALSMKKIKGESQDDSPFLGRFGIGILSGFLVADEINIYSRRAGGDGQTVHWVGKIDGTYTERLCSVLTESGTQVVLLLRKEIAEKFTPETIFESAQKYGRYLNDTTITFRCPKFTAPVNDQPPLWEQSLDDEEMLEAGRKIFDEPFLTAFKFKSQESDSQGIAFIKAEPCYPGAEAAHLLFIKRMLISERALDLEPARAPFLSIMMNSDRLRPNAGRDAVMANDLRLLSLRRDIEEALLGHLSSLHQNDPRRLASVVRSQYRCLAELSLSNHSYLRFLLDYLPMETTLGTMTVGEVFRRHTTFIEYVTDGTDFQRLRAKARSEGDCIMLVETETANSLIHLVSRTSNRTVAKRITSSEYLGRFISQSMAPSQREQSLLKELAAELSKEGCTGIFYETDERDEIARLDMGTDESLERLLSIKENDGSSAKKLLLNRLHPVISQMINGAADTAQRQAWLRLIYHCALLDAREVPTSAETRRFSRSLGNIFTAATLNSL